MLLTLQYAIIALLVLASALYVLQHRLPTLSRRLRVAVAVRLLRVQRPLWLHALARRIAPPSSQAGGCDGCSGGCRPE